MTDETGSRGGSGLQTVDRALRILDLVCASEGGASVTDLSRKSQLPKSTVHRLLSALSAHRLIVQDPHNQHYRPGIRLFELAQRSLEDVELREQALPELRALSRETEETVHLAILDDGDVIYIDKKESPKTIRMFSSIGKRGPAHCTGVGKVLLAALPEVDLEQYFQRKKLQAFTDKTITDQRRLREELKRVRERAYAVDDTEHESEIRCVAAPILDASGRVTAALSLTFPAFRAGVNELIESAPQVQESARRISQRLGWTGESLAPMPREISASLGSSEKVT